MNDEITTDHGFIRAWAEARDGRPALLENRVAASGAPLLRFDFGTPEPGLREIAWDEFFTIFEDDQLALSFREFPGQISRFYTLITRSAAAAAEQALPITPTEEPSASSN